uniref:Membrane protein n=1 Tax=Pithovirus LCPAC406 TaxID=2506599 RepID=A0A481ZF46_9VIRU|nr:MAG: membrane protein [Pithovirus LCPAC406]
MISLKMNTFWYIIIAVLIIILTIFVALALGENFKSNSCINFNNPFCFSDWTCSEAQGGSPNDGTDKPAEKLQMVVLECDKVLRGDPDDLDFTLCKNLWPGILPDGSI